MDDRGEAPRRAGKSRASSLPHPEGGNIREPRARPRAPQTTATLRACNRLVLVHFHPLWSSVVVERPTLGAVAARAPSSRTFRSYRS
jgi:hypothetical protein